MLMLISNFKKICPFVIFLVIAGCNSVGSGGGDDKGPWLIPESQVRDGGPGKDGIPSVDAPRFAPVDQIDFIVENRLVIGVKIGNEVKAYPHQILDWHEIVNDEVGDIPIAITYCPLTNTGIGWNREVNGRVTEFGVSGLLFRNNLIPYDRHTDSEWSQMQLRSVRGELSGQKIEVIDMVETSWSTWQRMYPNSQVMTTETGFARNYDGFAYGNTYRNNSTTLFPIRNRDNRLHIKERVHGIIADSMAPDSAAAKVYVISDMGDGITVIEDSFKGINHVVVGSSEFNLAASFEQVIDGTTLNFEPVEGALPIVMKDQEGNKWNIFGEAILGPREGQKLTPTQSYTGYWFAWGDFFPGVEIYGDQQ